MPTHLTAPGTPSSRPHDTHLTSTLSGQCTNRSRMSGLHERKAETNQDPTKPPPPPSNPSTTAEKDKATKAKVKATKARQIRAKKSPARTAKRNAGAAHDWEAPNYSPQKKSKDRNESEQDTIRLSSPATTDVIAP